MRYSFSVRFCRANLRLLQRNVRKMMIKGKGSYPAFALFALICIFAIETGVNAQQPYQKPPQAVLDVLNAPPPPFAIVSPTRNFVLITTGVRYPAIADLAQPMLRLAGERFNPANNGPHLGQYAIKLSIKSLNDQPEKQIALPQGAHISYIEWSPAGDRFSFANTTPTGIELWVGEAATGSIRMIKNVRLNAVLGSPIDWMPDGRNLLVRLVPERRGAPPVASEVPAGPNVQESSGKRAPVRTYEDLLKNPHDEQLFDYYATAQLAFVDSSSGKISALGQPGVFDGVDPSPDGSKILVVRIHHPYSYLNPLQAFPKDVDVWDRTGKLIYKLASLPLADQVPIEGVPTGPRQYSWRPTAGATLVWVEALDGGDPRAKVPFRDRLMMLNSPFTDKPIEFFKTEHRFAGMQWGERDGLLLVSDSDRDKRWRRTMILNADNSTEVPKIVWSRNASDRYNDPGIPLTHALSNGTRPILQDGEWIYLTGTGASPAGDRPFLDRFSLKTLKSERLYQSAATEYESVIGLASSNPLSVITRKESPTDAPNYFIRSLGSSAHASAVALTNYTDQAPQLRGIKKQLVTYKRADGVDLSFTLYLPPGYKEGTRLPTVIWAYPLEFTDAAVAGQVGGSAQRFTAINGPSQLFFLLAGYAVLDNATMPIVGKPETVNNTFVEQIVASAKAAIDKAAEMGVTDPDRVGVGGHSYGAFMTANLLAHSNLFRAGIARSGAYNRTLTPFGFQSERRTLWEAPELYSNVSPFMYADKIKDPILLIHGEADDNSGTFPIQSERLYQAVRGNGGTVRYVTLPLEAHGYSARESTEHVLFEMITWFDKYVKNAGPRKEMRQQTASGN
jgi:dipeptidyl aminopeptidase/acylaminoacyl peptidase